MELRKRAFFEALPYQEDRSKSILIDRLLEYVLNIVETRE